MYLIGTNHKTGTSAPLPSEISLRGQDGRRVMVRVYGADSTRRLERSSRSVQRASRRHWLALVLSHEAGQASLEPLAVPAQRFEAAQIWEGQHSTHGPRLSRNGGCTLLSHSVRCRLK